MRLVLRKFEIVFNMNQENSTYFRNYGNCNGNACNDTKYCNIYV